MDFASRVFFESRFLLGCFCFATMGLVLFARQRMESENARRRALWSILLGIPALFAVQALVVTQREVILDRLDRFVAAVEREDLSAARLIIARSYSSEGFGHETFIEKLQAWFERLDIRDARMRRRDVRVEGDRATMRLTATATVRFGGEGAGEDHIGRWRIEWAREDGTWSIAAIVPEMIDFREVTGMGSLRE